jgi:hypothetical protein
VVLDAEKGPGTMILDQLPCPCSDKAQGSYARFTYSSFRAYSYLGSPAGPVRMLYQLLIHLNATTTTLYLGLPETGIPLYESWIQFVTNS